MRKEKKTMELSLWLKCILQKILRFCGRIQICFFRSHKAKQTEIKIFTCSLFTGQTFLNFKQVIF